MFCQSAFHSGSARAYSLSLSYCWKKVISCLPTSGWALTISPRPASISAISLWFAITFQCRLRDIMLLCISCIHISGSAVVVFTCCCNFDNASASPTAVKDSSGAGVMLTPWPMGSWRRISWISVRARRAASTDARIRKSFGDPNLLSCEPRAPGAVINDTISARGLSSGSLGCM
jgi:hypothetical protein